jgi:glucose/arabinose dehydrogenase
MHRLGSIPLLATLSLTLAVALVDVPAAQAAPRAQLVASGFRGVVGFVQDPVYPDTFYVVQLEGLVRTIRNGVELTPLLDLRSVVTDAQDGRGLFSLAFPLDAASSGRVFVNFTDRTGQGNTVISRFTRSAGNPRVLDAASRKDLQWPAPGGGRQGFIAQPTAIHKGGNLAFGPDGYLYIALGDGGGVNDPNNNAQNPQSLLGKLLRVNVSVPDADPLGYSIPPGNPTFPIPNVLPEIWAFGLRNPWRYSFDDFGLEATDALVIGDVGESALEEIDYEPRARRGRNYGWRPFEGSMPTPNLPPESPAFGPVTPPIYEYPRTVGASVTGGYVYRGAALPELRGRFIYGDCIAGRIWSLPLTVNPDTGDATAGAPTDLTATLGGPFECITSFNRDRNGELYFMDIDFGNDFNSRIFRIVDGAALAPAPPVNLAANVTGQALTLTWAPSATGGTTTSYLLEAGTAAGLSDIGVLPLPTASFAAPAVPNGTYFVRVRAVGPGGVSPPTADVQVVVGCSAPPAAPAITTTAVANGIVTLGWTLPPGATGTIVEVGIAAGTTAFAVPYAAPIQALQAPAPAGTYFVRVRAVNTCGTGPASPEVVVTVP